MPVNYREPSAFTAARASRGLAFDAPGSLLRRTTPRARPLITPRFPISPLRIFHGGTVDGPNVPLSLHPPTTWGYAATVNARAVAGCPKITDTLSSRCPTTSGATRSAPEQSALLRPAKRGEGRSGAEHTL